MISLYRPILKRAFLVTIKNKWLWFLGFFAALIGNGGVYEVLLRSFNNLSEDLTIFFTLKEYAHSGAMGLVSWDRLKELWTTDFSAFGMGFFILLLFLCILALLISFGVIGQGSLIRGAIDIDQGKKTDMKKSVRSGLVSFWPILELNVITKIGLLGILMLLAYLVSWFSFESVLTSTLVYVISFVVFIVLGIIIYFLTLYGTAFIVLRKKNAFTGLKAAWTLVRKHFLLNLEMGLLLFIINVLVGIAFVIAAFILLSPFILLYFLLLFSGAKVAIFIVSLIALFIIVAFFIIVGAGFAVFQLSVWAILFEELVLKGGKSKTIRLLEGIKVRVVRRRPRKKKARKK